MLIMKGWALSVFTRARESVSFWLEGGRRQYLKDRKGLVSWLATRLVGGCLQVVFLIYETGEHPHREFS